MRTVIQAWDRLVAVPGVPSLTLCDAGLAYETFGDELGQIGTPSLMDTVGAIAAYRKALALEQQAVALDSSFLCARRSLSMILMKMGSVEVETDPAQALTEFQFAMKNLDAMPQSEQSSVSIVRIRATLLRKQGIAEEQLGAYGRANAHFEEAISIHRRMAAQDPKDQRALIDMAIVLDNQAVGYEDAADPNLAVDHGAWRSNLTQAEKNLVEATSELDRLLQQDPNHDGWRAFFDLMQVRLSAIEAKLHAPISSDTLSRKALAELKRLAAKDQT